MSSPIDFQEKRSFLSKIPPKVRLALGILLCLGAIFLTVLFIRASVKGLYSQNQSFVLEHIEVPVESDVLRHEVETAIRLAGIRQSESFLPELPLKTLRDELLKNPRVGDVKVRRFYPDTLRVEVISRMPVAILHFSPKSGKSELLIDQDGMVLPRNVTAASSKLPTVIGIKDPSQFTEGKPTEDKSVLAFLAFLKESRLRPEGSEYEILNVKLDEKNNRMTLILKGSGVFKSGAQLVMPMDDIPAELTRVQMVVELRRNENETISYINATYDNIPVRP